MRYLVAGLASVFLMTPAFSQVDSKTHALCKEAKDYLGCVKAMTGESSKPSTTTIRVVEGERELTGNSCPEDYAYAGSGWCSNIKCISRSSGHSPGLGGKRWKCGKIFGMGLALTWGDSKVKATHDPNCPSDPPAIGWTSSCEERDFAWMSK